MMVYIDIITDRHNGVTKIKQEDWLVQNGIIDVKHIKTGQTDKIGWPKQFNRWRFVDETDAMAFKLAWT